MTAVFANVEGEPAHADEIRRDVKVARWVATIAGLIGFVLSIATPLLPVEQTTATLNWPQQGEVSNVTSPLISQAPVSMTVTVPCDVIRGLPPQGGLVLATAPKKGKEATLNALFVNVTTATRRHHGPQCGGGECAPCPSGFACLRPDRHHLVG